MSDRVTTITGTNAAKAFPALAGFLATSTNLAPETAEQALRLACGDHIQSEARVAEKAMWKRAVDSANASIGVLPDAPATSHSVPDASGPWAHIVHRLNQERGLA